MLLAGTVGTAEGVGREREAAAVAAAGCRYDVQTT